MRAADITPGQEYAYRWRKWSAAVRVKVIERTVLTDNLPGWLVEVVETPHLNAGQYPTGRLFGAHSRQIDSTWSAHLFAKKAAEEQIAREQKAADERQALHDQALVELKEFYRNHGLDATNLSPGTMRFTPVQLLALVHAVKAASVPYAG